MNSKPYSMLLGIIAALLVQAGSANPQPAQTLMTPLNTRGSLVE
jgi:hypothetical protein